MPEPFCKLAPATEAEVKFVRLVKAGDAAELKSLLQADGELQRQVDQPWFSFDCPAIVASKSNIAIVDVLLEFGADINARSSWWAGSYGVLDGAPQQQADLLIDRGASLDINSAAALARTDVILEMVSSDPSCVNHRGGDGQTPLHVAAISVVDILLEHGAELETRCLDHSATAAQYAVTNSHKCRRLLDAGAKPDIFMAAALGDTTLAQQVINADPLALASRVGSCPHTKAIDPRADRHIYFWKLKSQATPLAVARAFGQPTIYQFLLDRSPVKQKFLAQCWAGDTAAAKKTIDQTTGLMGQLDEIERREMARAAWDGRLDVVKTMLDVGFDPHLPGDDHSTPLDRAAFHGHRQIVELLLQRDSKPPLEMKNAFGGTPLSCCGYGSIHSWKTGTDHLGTAAALIEAGAVIDPNWLPHENPIIDQLFRENI
jgi:ankyrin repeat protein